MRLSDMNRELSDDVQRIGKGAKGSAQRFLRALYVMQRRHDLAKTRLSRHQSFWQAVADVRKIRDAAFEPEYDRDYFLPA